MIKTYDIRVDDKVNLLVHALKGLLIDYTPDIVAESCGCDETGHCSWHEGYTVVNRITNDRYGEWYTGESK